MKLLPTLVSLATLILCVSGHMMFSCPAPRTTNSGIKTGPCGEGSIAGNQRVNLVPNAWNTITLQQTINHDGAPVR
jgi:hypothetical protein